MKAELVLSECLSVLHDRGQERDQGDGERSFDRAAEIFNSENTRIKISGFDVACVLTAVKRARIMTELESGILKKDSWLDLINYTALAFELISKEYDDGRNFSDRERA